MKFSSLLLCFIDGNFATMLRFCFVVLVFIGLGSTSAEIWSDDKCDRDLNFFEEALQSRELWALESKTTSQILTSSIFKEFFIQVFDLWAKISSGYSVGSTRNFGHFTDCLRFRHQRSGGTIQGQHCLVTFKGMNSTFERDEDEKFDWREV
jgi:hypothetical protein